jgi:hypothetical protein
VEDSKSNLQCSSLIALTEQVLYTIQDTHQESDNRPDSPGILDEDSLDDIVADLKTDMQCLIDLDPMYECPVNDLESEPPDSPAESPPSWTPYQYYVDRICRQFPLANPDLVLRFGQGNLNRFLRVLAEREDQLEREQATDLHGGEVATLEHSKFHDSGIGSSIPVASKYADTVMSFQQVDGSSLQIPSLPEKGKQGQPFLCMVCARTIYITNRPLWK